MRMLDHYENRGGVEYAAVKITRSTESEFLYT